MNSIKVHAIRTSCFTGQETDTIIEITREYIESLESWWIKIIKGGVTGYESMQEKLIKEDIKKEWYACAGTEGRWDSLFLPAESLYKIKEWLKQ